MKPREKPTERSIAETAGDWFLRRQSGLASAEQADFDCWLAADSRHAAAFEEFGRTWAELSRPREAGFAALALMALANRRRQRARSRTQISLWAGALAFAALVIFALVPFGSVPSADKNMPESVALRPDRQVLPDGSMVELNAGAHYEVMFTARERGIRLIRGEALFTVKKDPARPFVVSAGAVAVRAVGTVFSVRHDPAAVDVLVTEGRVAVDRISTEPPMSGTVRVQAPPTFVNAGGRITVPVTTSPQVALPTVPLTPAQINHSLAWRNKRIEFSDTPLVEVFKLFNQQHTLQLRTADVATGQLQVSGIFWADDPETFVRLVATGLNLHSERVGDVITLRRK
jgi:transmembrane sensor